jgi:hypothetical protein
METEQLEVGDIVFYPYPYRSGLYRIEEIRPLADPSYSYGEDSEPEVILRKVGTKTGRMRRNSGVNGPFPISDIRRATDTIRELKERVNSLTDVSI